jgi:hypothetical protein
MRISTRLIAALLLSAGLIAAGSTWWQIPARTVGVLRDEEGGES